MKFTRKERATRLRKAAEKLIKRSPTQFSCVAVKLMLGETEQESYAFVMGSDWVHHKWHELSLLDIHRDGKQQNFRAMLVLMYAAMVEAGDDPLSQEWKDGWLGRP